MTASKLGNSEVAKELQDFLDGTGGKGDWDWFLSDAELANERLEQIRRHCNLLSDEFPPVASRGYCSEKGLAVIRRYIAELRGA
jgi:hypothetical protein